MGTQLRDEPAGICIRTMLREDWKAVARIYAEGIESGEATFESQVPEWDEFDASRLASPRLVLETGGVIAGWAALSAVSKRACYRGVAEFSIYLATAARGKGYGAMLLDALIQQSEAEGFWTLQGRSFLRTGPALRWWNGSASGMWGGVNALRTTAARGATPSFTNGAAPRPGADSPAYLTSLAPGGRPLPQVGRGIEVVEVKEAPVGIFGVLDGGRRLMEERGQPIGRGLRRGGQLVVKPRGGETVIEFRLLRKRIRGGDFAGIVHGHSGIPESRGFRFRDGQNLDSGRAGLRRRGNERGGFRALPLGFTQRG